MDIYDLLNSIASTQKDHLADVFRFSFRDSEREMLSSSVDKDIFDLFRRSYAFTIVTLPERKWDHKAQDYRTFNKSPLQPYTDDELRLVDSLDWSRIPKEPIAHVFDTIWLCNKKPDAARKAYDTYFDLYHDNFDVENWVVCFEYVCRAVELAGKLGDKDSKNGFLTNVYYDVIKLNGSDTSNLSVSLIELLLNEADVSDCNFKSLLPITDKLIIKSYNNIYVEEASYKVKAEIYKKLKDVPSSNQVYVDYADALMASVGDVEAQAVQESQSSQASSTVSDSHDVTTDESVIKSESNTDSGRDWFIAERNIETAIAFYQRHGAPEKARVAQAKLNAVGKEVVKHLAPHTFKYDVTPFHDQFMKGYADHDVHQLLLDMAIDIGFQDKRRIRNDLLNHSSFVVDIFPMESYDSDGHKTLYLPPLDPNDEDNVLQHMYHRAREEEIITGNTIVYWFIQLLHEKGFQESDLDFIFDDNPIVPEGQENQIKRGLYNGLTLHMSDALDTLGSRAENMIRNLAEMCGDQTVYFDINEGVSQRKVLGEIFAGEKLKECVDENILFTFNGLLQQKAGSNIRNIKGHGIDKEAECRAGDCIYFVAMMLKFCAMYTVDFEEEVEKRIKVRSDNKTTNNE